MATFKMSSRVPSLVGFTALLLPLIPVVPGTFIPPPPNPEAIEVTELRLPPAITSHEIGACSDEMNPHRTGCIHQTTNLLGGGFTPDGLGVWAGMDFAGAPESPDPGSIYNGTHLVLIKADGSNFTNGDSWKCITCGVPKENGKFNDGDHLEYPQAFKDGTRVLAGSYIIDCGGISFASEECTPEQVHIHPIYWSVTVDGTGASGSIRELRLHPDDVHLAWSSLSSAGQTAFVGRLSLNELPTTGIPLAPRYDLTHVNVLFDPSRSSSITVEGGKMQIRPDAITIGEVRGFSGTGAEVTYVGYPAESCNMDVFAINLYTGKIRRLTRHPEYADPVDISPDDKWTAVMDTRGSNRQMFMAGMRQIPPVIDLLVTAAASSTRNNGERRFFQPYLIDSYGDRGSYFGQQINAAGSGIPGSGAINDPEWNGRADPKWSPGGNRIVYFQALTLSPACGGENPLPCYSSTAEGGRDRRLMVADLVSRQPKEHPPVDLLPDTIPWAIPYELGSAMPVAPRPPRGNFTLEGLETGSADVMIVEDDSRTSITTVRVTYREFSNDGLLFLNGNEQVTYRVEGNSLPILEWHSNLTQHGETNGTKMTSPGGFFLTVDMFHNVFEANGTLTTTLDGVVYTQPQNGA